MKRFIYLFTVVFIIVSSSFSQEVKRFIFYSKIYDLESNSEKIFCASNTGILIYDKMKGEFQNYGDKEKNLAGEKVFSVLRNNNTKTVLAFSNEGVYELIAGKYWERIHESIGRIISYKVADEIVFVKNSENKVYEYSDTDLELKRINEVIRNFKSIHKKNERDIFPRNSFKINDLIEVLDYEKIDSQRYVISTRVGYLLIYDDMRNEYIINLGSVYDDKITNIFKSEKRMFFLGNRINVFQNNRYDFINIPQLKNNINDISGYKNNSLLIASRSNGIFQWKNNDLKSKYMIKDGLLSNNILQVINTNQYIFALSRYGVSIINEAKKEVDNIKGIDYYRVDNMKYFNDLLILQKKDGIIIRNIENNSEVAISASDLLNDILTDIEVVKHSIYVSGNLGISKYNLKTDKIENVINFNRKINDILFYDNRIYIGSEDGLFFYNLEENETSEFRENSELSSLNILKIININDEIFLKTSKGIDVIL
ncbi:MAG: hypothetical protein FXF47_06295 [Candidatus Mcinerneyibacterium aminivorans]|uniref:WD40 repeat domain-containing protein n=1 Tax=Candidatus Mcinerneyibacterium aminivorans TaxID=2703815 RepID=A0A5D0MHX7_9BACT|nr:MAG: hypothetical protein FXF47_06295 [Candidatus Mcinerneyibacterium aminivorans]